MGRFLHKLIDRMERYAKTWWYAPMLAVLAAADAYLIFIPNEALLIPAVLSHPKKWFRLTFWMSVGSALGAASFAALASSYGGPFLERVDPHIFHSRGWHETSRIINDVGGIWGVALVSFSPLPQHAAVALVGLAHMPWTMVLVAVLIGRLAKYTLIAWCAVHSPRILRKLGLFPEALERPKGDPKKRARPASATT